MSRKRIAVVLISILTSLSLSSAITPFLSFSPFFLYDAHSVIDEDPNWKKRDEATGIHGFDDLLDRYDGVPGSMETIQDAVLRFENRPELLGAGFEIETESIFFALKIEIREELYNFISSSPLSNIPFVGNTQFCVTNAQYPQVAFIEYRTPSFFVSVGRRKLDMGPGKYSFMLSSEAQPNLDAAAIGGEYKEGDFSLGYTFYAIGGSNATLNPHGEETKTMKNFFIHSVSASNSSFRFSLSELNCVYGTVPGIYDFTPFVLWHNLYQEEHSNVMIELSLEGRIGPLRIWGIYAQDDIFLNFKGLNEGGFNNKPTGIGFSIGFDYEIEKGEEYGMRERNSGSYSLKEPDFATSGGIHLVGEFYWATNYLYNRRSDYAENDTVLFKNDKYGKITLPYRFYSSHGGFTDKQDAYYLGFPYGPGSIFCSLALEGEWKVFRCTIGASLLMRGDAAIDTEINESTADTWLGLIGEKKRLWSLNGEFRYDLFNLCGSVEALGKISLGYDEYCSSFVPVAQFGFIWTL
ncbi:MAG: hypothetical protein ACI4S4_06475 [Candidatus Ornithospirochaeta sp.]